MVWAAFWFGQQGATLLVLCLSLVSVLATARGVGIFAASAPSEAMLLLQSFAGVVSLTILIVLSTINQQETAEQLCHSTRSQRTEFVIEIPVYQAFKPDQDLTADAKAVPIKV